MLGLAPSAFTLKCLPRELGIRQHAGMDGFPGRDVLKLDVAAAPVTTDPVIVADHGLLTSYVLVSPRAVRIAACASALPISNRVSNRNVRQRPIGSGTL